MAEMRADNREDLRRGRYAIRSMNIPSSIQTTMAINMATKKLTLRIAVAKSPTNAPTI